MDWVHRHRDCLLWYLLPPFRPVLGYARPEPPMRDLPQLLDRSDGLQHQLGLLSHLDPAADGQKSPIASEAQIHSSRYLWYGRLHHPRCYLEQVSPPPSSSRLSILTKLQVLQLQVPNDNRLSIMVHPRSLRRRHRR